MPKTLAMFDELTPEQRRLVKTLSSSEQGFFKSSFLIDRGSAVVPLDTWRELLMGLLSLYGKREVLTRIAAMTDADDPDSHRSDDQEGCLDSVHALAKKE